MTHEPEVFDLLDTLAHTIPELRAGYARSTGGIDWRFILDTVPLDRSRTTAQAVAWHVWNDAKFMDTELPVNRLFLDKEDAEKLAATRKCHIRPLYASPIPTQAVPPAERVGQLVNEALMLAPSAGLFLEITIKPAETDA